MRNLKFIGLIIILLISVSCSSDGLSNRKAEKIKKECLKEKPLKRSVTIRLEAIYLKGEDLEIYRKLESDGFLEIKDNKSYRDGYDIKITKKARKYIEEAPENMKKIKMKSHVFEVDEVLEVQEIPSLNSATVKVRFEAKEITPFSILYVRDPAEFWIEDYTMKKTSNGWKYCDNF